MSGKLQSTKASPGMRFALLLVLVATVLAAPDPTLVQVCDHLDGIARQRRLLMLLVSWVCCRRDLLCSWTLARFEATSAPSLALS